MASLIAPACGFVANRLAVAVTTAARICLYGLSAASRLVLWIVSLLATVPWHLVVVRVSTLLLWAATSVCHVLVLVVSWIVQYPVATAAKALLQVVGVLLGISVVVLALIQRLVRLHAVGLLLGRSYAVLPSGCTVYLMTHAELQAVALWDVIQPPSTQADENFARLVGGKAASWLITVRAVQGSSPM